MITQEEYDAAVAAAAERAAGLASLEAEFPEFASSASFFTAAFTAAETEATT